METYETIEYRGFNINIHYDDCGESPREWDNLGKMVCWHRRYNLGDEQPNENNEDYWRSIAYDHVPFETDDLDMDTVWKIIDKHYIVLPLYLYDHSGITMNTSGFSCPWDSGQVGWIYVSKKAVREEWGWKRIGKRRWNKIARLLEGEVETYDQYLTGQVYFYTIEAKDTNKSISCDDSCGGFYGYDHKTSGLLDTAENAIDYAIEKYRKKVKADKKRRVELNSFIDCCWAY